MSTLLEKGAKGEKFEKGEQDAKWEKGEKSSKGKKSLEAGGVESIAAAACVELGEQPRRRRRRRSSTSSRKTGLLQRLVLVSTYDAAIEVLLSVALAFCPFAFGAFDPGPQQVEIILVTAIAACLCLRLMVSGQTRFARSWAYLPAALFVSLVALQLLPLPAAWVASISPRAVSFRQEALAAAWRPVTALNWTTLSLYPYATRAQLRVLLAACIVFVAVINLYRDEKRVIRLLWTITGIGLAQAVLQLAQMITGTHYIYWVQPMGHLNSGTFANHSHFSQFMNMTVGAAAALLFIRLRRLAGKRQLRGDVLLALRSSADARVVWVLAAIIVTMLLAMLLSLSRGGMLSAGIGGLFAAAAFMRTATVRWRNRVITLLLLCGIGTAAILGSDVLAARAATLGTVQEHDLRPLIFHDALSVFGDFTLLGAGLGSHERIFPAYQTLLAFASIAHADNEYAQLAEEMGVAGLTLAALFVALIAAAAWRASRPARPPIRAAAAGLLFGFIAILIGSATDFGQHVPGVNLLTAATCALLLNLSRMRSTKASAEDGAAEEPAEISPAADAPPPPLRARLAGFGALFAVVALLAWMNVGANDCRAADARWNDAVAVDRSLRAEAWQGDGVIYDRLVSAADDAVANEPANAWYAHWAAVYRWQGAVARVTDPDSGLFHPDAGTFATGREAVVALLAIPAKCPTMAAPWAAAAEICLALGDQHKAVVLMRRAEALGPSDPPMLYSAARLAVALGHASDAVPRLRRCLAAQEYEYRQPAINMLLSGGRPDLALDVGDGRPVHAATLYRMLGVPASDDEWTAKRAAGAQARAACESGDVDLGENIKPGDDDSKPQVAAVAADDAAFLGNKTDALRYYRMALAGDPSVVDWRIDMAHSMAALGDLTGARDELAVCLRLSPGNWRAQQELFDLRPRSQ